MPVVDQELRLGEQRSAVRNRFTTPLLVTFSLYYFADVLIRASEKYFWFDELVTLDVCRLSGVRAMWQALLHGVDFNPPLFYVITNAAKAVFGNNRIGPRVPEMIAFWILCLCLFRFVNRRAGPIAALIAMMLPTITGAFYYAYEARPHGLVLGFCGLALISWQMALEQPERRRWVWALSLCILGACAVHCYGLLLAIPFGIVELINGIRMRRINWPMWLALAVPVTIGCVSYIPLLLSYRAITKGTDWSQSYMANLGHLVAFYTFLLSPCILFLMWSFAALAADRVIGRRFADSGPINRVSALRSEEILGVCFVAMPVIGFLVAKFAVHGLFIDRYFLSTLVGVCTLLGLACGARGWKNWMPVTLAVLLAFPVLWNFGALVWHRYRGMPEKLTEPSSSFTMNASLTGPLGRYSELLPNDSRPIGVLKFYDFLYLLHYAPEIRPHMYYVKQSTHDFFDAGFENFHPWAGFQYNSDVSADGFVRLAPRSYILGVTDMEGMSELSNLVKAGGTIVSMRTSNDHFLAEIEGK